MQRPYQNSTQNDVRFFVGTEVEHTPLLGRKTLFVVGIQPVQDILYQAQASNVSAIYLGANQSFDPGDWHNGDHKSSDSWNRMISDVLKLGYWTTLDFDVRHAEWVAEGGYCENNKFVPMISVKIPYVSQFNYNTTVKIDDKDFDKSNPGVWCHRLVELMQPSKFTDWSSYTQDKPL
jgi:hypothetical protein